MDMGTFRHLIAAAVFFLVFASAGRTVDANEFHDENWRTFVYEIASPIKVRSDLDISWRSGFHENTSAACHVDDLERTALREYYGQGPLLSVASNILHYNLFRKDAVHSIFLGYKPVNIADSKVKGKDSFIMPDRSYPTYEDIIMSPDADLGFLPNRLDRVSGRSWFVPFSLPVKPLDDGNSFMVPDAVSMGLEIDYFRMANDIKMFGSGDIHFPSVVGRNRTGWINPESGLLRFDWKWGGETVN